MGDHNRKNVVAQEVRHNQTDYSFVMADVKIRHDVRLSDAHYRLYRLLQALDRDQQNAVFRGICGLSYFLHQSESTLKGLHADLVRLGLIHSIRLLWGGPTHKVRRRRKPKKFVKLPVAVLFDLRLSDRAVRVFEELCWWNSHPVGGDPYPANRTVGKPLGMSERTIERAMKELKDYGLVKTESRGFDRTTIKRTVSVKKLYTLESLIPNINVPREILSGQASYKFSGIVPVGSSRIKSDGPVAPNMAERKKKKQTKKKGIKKKHSYKFSNSSASAARNVEYKTAGPDEPVRKHENVRDGTARPPRDFSGVGIRGNGNKRAAKNGKGAVLMNTHRKASVPKKSARPLHTPKWSAELLHILRRNGLHKIFDQEMRYAEKLSEHRIAVMAETAADSKKVSNRWAFFSPGPPRQGKRAAIQRYIPPAPYPWTSQNDLPSTSP